MDYVVTYISDMLAHILGTSTLLDGSASLFPTTVSACGTATTEFGNKLMDLEDSNGNKSSLLQTAGTSITATGTAVSMNSDVTSQKAIDIQKQRYSQAYIESLDEEQLSTFIAKLDNIEIKDNNKQLKLK